MSDIEVEDAVVDACVKLHGCFVISCEPFVALVAIIQHCVEIAVTGRSIKNLWTIHPAAPGGIDALFGLAVRTSRDMVRYEKMGDPGGNWFNIERIHCDLLVRVEQRAVISAVRAHNTPPVIVGKERLRAAGDGFPCLLLSSIYWLL